MPIAVATRAFAVATAGSITRPAVELHARLQALRAQYGVSWEALVLYT